MSTTIPSKKNFKSVVSPTDVFESGKRLLESGEITSPTILWCVKAITTLAINAAANYRKRNELDKRIKDLEDRVIKIQLRIS